MISSLEYNLGIKPNTTKVQITKIESTSRLAKNGKIENTRCHRLRLAIDRRDYQCEEEGIGF
ncbi:hypothetical protein Hanom_Chr07g00608231 [Helianthus anomalus]